MQFKAKVFRSSLQWVQQRPLSGILHPRGGCKWSHLLGGTGCHARLGLKGEQISDYIFYRGNPVLCIVGTPAITLASCSGQECRINTATSLGPLQQGGGVDPHLKVEVWGGG